MQFSRNQFFVLLFFIFVAPFIISKLYWIVNSKKANGEMRFVGHGDLGSALGISTYPVIRFYNGHDFVYFNGNLNEELKPGDRIGILYQQNKPADARMDTFSSLWGDTFSYILLPALVLLVLYIKTDIIPRKAKIVLGKKGLLSIA